jgi:hypothetical protein
MQFISQQRRSGTSSLLKRIADHNDVWILVPDDKSKSIFGDSALSFEDLSSQRATKKKPILVDNHTLIRFCEMTHTEIESLENEIQRRDLLISKIDHLMDDFKGEKQKISYGNKYKTI